MKKEITTREDIHFIISEFYKLLIADSNMLPFFKEIVDNNHLPEHLEIITDFWEDLLLETYKYKNNPMQKHLDFQKKVSFEKKHFDLWLKYLHQTIDANFLGETAHAMKTRASSIAMVMQLKMNLHN